MIEMPDPIAQQQDLVPAPTLPPPSPPPPLFYPSALVSSGSPSSVTYSTLLPPSSSPCPLCRLTSFSRPLSSSYPTKACCPSPYRDHSAITFLKDLASPPHAVILLLVLMKSLRLASHKALTPIVLNSWSLADIGAVFRPVYAPIVLTDGACVNSICSRICICTINTVFEHSRFFP